VDIARPAPSPTAARDVPPSRWSVRALLVGLLLASLLPGLGVAVFLLVREYNGSVERQQANLVAVARSLTQAADARLFNARLLGQALTATAAMERQDLPALHRRARELIAVTQAARIVVLSDTNGQQLLNTLIEFGKPLPAHGNPGVLRRVLESEAPVISDVYTGGVLGRPVLSVDLPVRVGGRVTRVLSVGLLPADLDSVLHGSGLSPDWVVAIFDASGTIVTRSHAPGQFVGQKGTAELIERIQATGEGVVATTTREGIEVVSAFSRSPATGWSAAIGVPRRELVSGLRRPIAVLVSGFSVLFAAGVALAWFVASRIGGSMRALIAPATALGAEEEVRVPRIAISEAAEVAEAMGSAGKLLRDRARALEEANAALRASQAELAAASERLEIEVAQRTSELTAANATLARIARQDALTGLQNRLAANERLREEHARMKRTGQAYAVLLMDVDHFKRINDTLGHEAGDEALRRMAALLGGSFREVDFVARFGGEEFLVVLPATDLEGAMSSARKVRSEIAGLHVPGVGQVTVSLGVAAARPADASDDDVVRRADAALYRAKAAGRDAVMSE